MLASLIYTLLQPQQRKLNNILLIGFAQHSSGLTVSLYSLAPKELHEGT